jgi:hypothetical protein
MIDNDIVDKHRCLVGQERGTAIAAEQEAIDRETCMLQHRSIHSTVTATDGQATGLTAAKAQELA